MCSFLDKNPLVQLCGEGEIEEKWPHLALAPIETLAGKILQSKMLHWHKSKILSDFLLLIAAPLARGYLSMVVL